jgi:hypothetical protein
MTPPALDRLVQICLAKDPDDRWQTVHDVMLQLRFIAEGNSADHGRGDWHRAIRIHHTFGAAGSAG